MGSPTIAIAGSSGQLAQALLRQAALRNVTANAAGRPQLDMADAASVHRLLAATKPDLVINAAAYTAVDRAEAEPDLAHAVNALGPQELARACATRSIPVIHISTDYVFDGLKPAAYLETDAVAPVSVYGRTKALGEDAVRANTPRHVIVRTSWVYGPDGSNFVNTMLRLAAERDEIGVVGDQHGAPTRVDDLAAALLTIAAKLGTGGDHDLWGTYHLAGGGETTWHGFAEAIFEHLKAAGKKTPRLNRIATSDYPTPAKRPANSVLDQAKISAAFGIALPDWRVSLAQHFNEAPAPAQLQRDHA